MKKKSDDTRSRLLEAAAEEFALCGYAKTNINTVSQKAGFGKGTVYNYFRNKFDLFLSVFTQAMNEVARDIAEAAAASSDPVEKLEKAIYADFRYFQENESLVVLILRESYTAEKEKQSQFVEAAMPVYELYASFIAEGIEKGVYRPDLNPLVATVQFLGMSENLILNRQYLGDALGTPEMMAEYVIDTFIRGIKA